MKIRVNCAAMAFVEEENRARFDPLDDTGRNGSRVFADRIETPHRPADQPQLAPFERGMNKGIFHPGG